MDKQALYNYATKEELALAENIRTTMYRYDQLEQHYIQSLNEVADQDIKRFWQQGYLAIENVLTTKEVDTAIEAIMDIISGRVEGPHLQFVKPKNQLKNDTERELAIRKLDRFVKYEPRLRAIAHHQGILSVLEKLHGEKSKLVQDQAILKPPSGGVEKPWHQDMAYGNLTYEKPVIGVWVALDQAELENGCMHVIPRSHMNGPTPHYAVRDWQVCDTNVPVEKDVAVPLKPGGILIFHGMLFHGTPPNFSPKRRRSVQYHYAPSSSEKMSPKEYKRWFTNEMTNAEC